MRTLRLRQQVAAIRRGLRRRDTARRRLTAGSANLDQDEAGLLMVGPWRHPPGTLCAPRTILGHQYVVCHGCRRFTAMVIPAGMEDRKYEPCPVSAGSAASVANS